MKKRDYLTGLELAADETRSLLGRALSGKSKPPNYGGALPLAGKSFALLFEKHSTRTRVSFEVGIAQLGGNTIFLAPGNTHLDREETLSDSAKVLSQYVDGIILRTFGHERAEQIAENATVPVINGLSDSHHPCQALADFLTLQERFGTLKDLKLSYLGDGNNVLHSLLLVGALIGINISAGCPSEYMPHPGIVAQAKKFADASSVDIHITDDVKEACEGAHALYADVWTSMGQEGQEETRRRLLSPYRIHDELFHWTDKQAIFMHCLPAHRGEEVTEEVIDGPRSVVFQQAGNRLYAQKALLEMIFGAPNGR